MTATQQIAKHLREVHFGGNWTAVNLDASLADVTWQQADAAYGKLHSISTLVFHMNYYVVATIKVLRDGKLDANDTLSFDCPRIGTAEDWNRLVEKTLSDANELASLIDAMPDEQLWNHFVEEKYGTYYRCLHGLIEHCHYHLGQIAMIKTLQRTAE